MVVGPRYRSRKAGYENLGGRPINLTAGESK